MLNIRKTTAQERVALALEGRLDTTTAPQLEQALRGSLDGAGELILDLEQLEYISSAGLRVLLWAQKEMNRRGEMKLVGVNEIIMDIFEVTGFSEILSME